MCVQSKSKEERTTEEIYNVQKRYGNVGPPIHESGSDNFESMTQKLISTYSIVIQKIFGMDT